MAADVVGDSQITNQTKVMRRRSARTTASAVRGPLGVRNPQPRPSAADGLSVRLSRKPATAASTASRMKSRSSRCRRSPARRRRPPRRRGRRWPGRGSRRAARACGASRPPPGRRSGWLIPEVSRSARRARRAPEHRGGGADAERDGAPARRAEPFELAQRARASARRRGRAARGPAAGRRPPRRARAAWPRAAWSGVRSAGGQRQRVARRGGGDAAPASRSSPSGVRPGPRPSSASAARRRAATSPLPSAAKSAATAARGGRVAASERAAATPAGPRDAERAEDRARRARPARARARSGATTGSHTTVGPGPSAIALGSHGVPGAVTEGHEAVGELELPDGEVPAARAASRAWTGAAIAATLTPAPRPARPARRGTARAAGGRCRRRSGPRPASRAGRRW